MSFAPAVPSCSNCGTQHGVRFQLGGDWFCSLRCAKEFFDKQRPEARYPRVFDYRLDPIHLPTVASVPIPGTFTPDANVSPFVVYNKDDLARARHERPTNGLRSALNQGIAVTGDNERRNCMGYALEVNAFLQIPQGFADADSVDFYMASLGYRRVFLADIEGNTSPRLIFCVPDDHRDWHFVVRDRTAQGVIWSHKPGQQDVAVIQAGSLDEALRTAAASYATRATAGFLAYEPDE